MKELFKKYVRYYFTFSGRITRTQYVIDLLLLMLAIAVIAVLTAMIAFIGIWVIAELLHIPNPNIFAKTTSLYCGPLFSIVAAVAWAAITTRRLHDFKGSLFWVILAFVLHTVEQCLARQIPERASELYMIANMDLAIGLFQLGFFAALLFWPGTKGSNKFGENPRKSKVLEKPLNTL